MTSPRTTVTGGLVKRTGLSKKALRRILDYQFEFDTSEHQLAQDHTEALRDRFREFLSGGPDGSPETRVMTALRDAIAGGVPAYALYPDAGSLSELPLVERSRLRTDPESFRAPMPAAERAWRMQTSGTTGSPLTVWYSSLFYFEQRFLTVRKIAALAGIESPGRRSVFCVAVTDDARARDLVLGDPADEVGVSLQIMVHESRPEALHRLFRILQVVKPTSITGEPATFQMILAGAARADAQRLQSPDLVVSSGTTLDDSLRDGVQRFFHAKVLNAYGMTEVGLVASECARQDGLHVDQSSVLVEIVGPDGEAAPPGRRGELVVSTIANRAMPLLRYRTGDLATLVAEPCACGFPGPRLTSLCARQAP